jgi:methionyl-tRNA formyltransferase
MRILAIGRTKVLLEAIIKIIAKSHDTAGIVTAKPAPEYKKKEQDFENIAKELNVPFLSGVSLVEIESALKQIAADIAVSVNFTNQTNQNY